MHSTVPNEILIKIFQQLHPIDQLECMFVCHRWNQLIEDSVFYHTVFIYSPESLKKLLQKIQQRPDIANRIQRLFLWLEEEEERGGGEEVNPSSELLSLVPNLKVLWHRESTVFWDETQYPWYNQIEHISEYAPLNTTNFPSYTYPNLKTLSYLNTYEPFDFPEIENTSALTSLTLEGVGMNFNVLEMIHEAAPHLKSLKFSASYFYGEDFFSGKEITPATSVTEFLAFIDWNPHFDPEPVSSETIANLLLYVSRKYPNLSTLEYILYNHSRLDYNQVAAAGLIPLLQRLGPQLKKVYTSFSDETDDLIDKFDEFDCQINDFTLRRLYDNSLKKLAQSKQTFYLQTLVLSIRFPPLDWLKNFRVLKKLELFHCEPHKMQFGDILDNCPPTLESLSLNLFHFDIDPNYTGTSNIKTLIFQHMNFDDDKIDGFISRCFPQLSSLELNNCKLQNDRLNLETTDLVNFYYRFCGYQSYHGTDRHDTISVTTLKDNTRRSYVLYNKFKKQLFYDLYVKQHTLEGVFYPQNYRPFKSYPVGDINDPESAFNFICNSVGNVVFR